MANTKVQSEQIANDAVVTSHIADNVGLGGSPTTTTQSASDNSTKIATTAYVDAAFTALVDSSPTALNTLNELAAALGDDANFSTTVTNSIATKLPLAGGTMTGNIIMGDDTSIGIADDAERIEFDGAGDINILGANLGIGTTSPLGSLSIGDGSINDAGLPVQISTGADGTQAWYAVNRNGGYGALFGYSVSSTYKGLALRNVVSAGTSNADGISFLTNNTSMRMHIAGDGKVGIGTATANKIFNIADPAQGGETLKLHFEAESSADKWAIYSYDRTNGHYADLSFGGNYLYLKSGGNVGIGTTSPNYSLDVGTIGHNSTGEILLTGGNSASNDYTQTALLRLRATSINPNRTTHDDNASVAEIRLNHGDKAGNNSDGFISFYTNPSNYNTAVQERMRILAGGGLTFNGDTAAANALDDYEEGTWNPSFIGTAGSAGSWAESTWTARYTKIGRVVRFHASGYITNKGSYSGNSRVAGLPYTNAGSTTACTVSLFPDSDYPNTKGIVAQVAASSSEVHFFTGARADVAHAWSDVGTGYYCNISGHYEVS